MAGPLTPWIIKGAVVAGGAVLAWWAKESTDAVVEDVDTLGDVAIGALTGVAVGAVTDNALLGVSAGLAAYMLARNGGRSG